MSHPTAAARLAGVVLLALGVSSCGEGAATSSFHVDELPELEAVEELRIGSVDDPDFGFARIRGVEVGPDGMLYVLEDQQKEIRVYDPAGALVRTIGQEGRGPGELDTPVAFGLLGDTLWVNDMRNNRITLFSTMGELLGTVPTGGVSSTVAGVPVRIMPYAPRGDGTYSSFIASMAFPGSSAPDTFSTPKLIFNHAGEVVDSAGWELNRPSMGSLIEIGNRRIGMSNPLPDQPLRRTQNADTFVIDRPAAADAGTAEFVVAKLAADTIYRKTFTYTPEPVPDDFLIAAVRQRLGSDARVTDGAIAAAVEGLFMLPEFHPPIAAAEVGEDGSLWLKRPDYRSDGGAERSAWLVIRPDGTLRGEVALPRDARLEWVTAEAALVVEPDEFDVPWLVRYRIAPM